jgi:hypothetical protein
MIDDLPAPMRVSDFYKLPYRQDGLDFVDVDVVGDDPLFVDPRALRTLRGPWADECVSLIQDFFGVVLTATRTGLHSEAVVLLRHLREPNETHLGLSRGRARGRALGPVSAHDLWDALVGSEAIRSGLLEDLEETVLMIEGISFDIVSDIATNIIRAPLIRFTQEQADLHGIPMEEVDSGPLWDPASSQWTQKFERLPAPDRHRLILVPKVIVRRKLHYEPNDYFNNYVLTFLMEEEISAKSELVRLLKDGTPRVTKKALRAKYGAGKHVAVEITKRHPEILDQFRVDKAKRGPVPLDHDDLAAEMTGTSEPDWEALMLAVTSVAPGKAGADQYHRAIQALLTPLFHPALAMPQRETPLHEGRKRVDLTYSNLAQSGFFAWVSNHHPAMYLLIECKNYTGDPANPELDQLAGRFGPSRGKVGILVCRRFEDKDLFIKRCRDTVSDQRGFIVPLEDDDLKALVELRRIGDDIGMFNVLKARFDQIVM